MRISPLVKIWIVADPPHSDRDPPEEFCQRVFLFFLQQTNFLSYLLKGILAMNGING